MFQQNKSSKSKVKFRQASICCKRVLQAAKLALGNKTRVYHFPETWLSRLLLIVRIANSVHNKVKSAMPPLLNDLEVLSSASDKVKLFAKNFSMKSNLDDLGISLPVFPSRTNLNLHNISVTPKIRSNKS